MARIAAEDRWRDLAASTYRPAMIDAYDFDDDGWYDDNGGLSDEEIDYLTDDESELLFEKPVARRPAKPRIDTPHPAFFTRAQAEHVFEELQSNPSFAETLSPEQLATAWAALLEDQMMREIVTMKTNPVILRRMLLDPATQAAAVEVIASSAPIASIASAVEALLESPRSYLEAAALGVVVEGLQDRRVIDDEIVGEPVELAAHWLSTYQQCAP